MNSEVIPTGFGVSIIKNDLDERYYNANYFYYNNISYLIFVDGPNEGLAGCLLEVSKC